MQSQFVNRLYYISVAYRIAHARHLIMLTNGLFPKELWANPIVAKYRLEKPFDNLPEGDK